MRTKDKGEPTPAAADTWCDRVDEVLDRTLIARTRNWWMGADVPASPRQTVAYATGFGPAPTAATCGAAIDGLSDDVTAGRLSLRSA